MRFFTQEAFCFLMNERLIITTEDGSNTVYQPSLNVSYHSRHGAIRESKHVFIQSGLDYFFNEKKDYYNTGITVFEVGFGTGLNALLTLEFALQNQQQILYEAIEAYPLSSGEFHQLNYTSLMDKNLNKSFIQLHDCNWNETISIHQYFSFKKIKTDLEQFNTDEKFYVLFFDAFDPNTQPALWTEAIFTMMFDMLLPNGILVTYCSKGIVQRAMKAAGFIVQKLKGPPGKREVIRAIKTIH